MLAGLLILLGEMCWVPSRPVGEIANANEKAALDAGLEVGTPAPMFTVHDLEGNAATLGGLRESGQPVLLAFVQPRCGACRRLAPDLGR
jgi:thiol-disulfide isomerase/thioredoxin